MATAQQWTGINWERGETTLSPLLKRLTHKNVRISCTTEPSISQEGFCCVQ